MAKQESTFLKHLKLDPRQEKSFIAAYLGNSRLVILLLLLIILIGLSSFFGLSRTLNPEIKIPIVVVTTILPGANPQDIESLVTIPIEDSVRGVQKIKTLTSTSQDSVSSISIEFNSGVDPDKAKADIQSAVDSVTTLPQDAQTPTVIKLDFENQPVWIFDVTTSKDDGSLFRFAKDLQAKLKDLPEIDKADVSGLEDTEVQITIKPEAFTTYQINPVQISQLVTSALKAFPAGSVRAQNSTFAMSINAQAVTVADIRKLEINLNGQPVALSQIAFISEHPKPDQSQSYLIYPNQIPKRSVTFNVYKVSSVNIDTAANAATTLVEDQIKASGGGFQIATVQNTSEEIDRQFFDLARDFTITIVLVVIVLFIFLGGRQALVSALSAPLSFLIVFSVMKATGISLNFLSLFSLILSLGLLVDDTVVVISAMTFYYKTGRFTPLQTGLLVWRDFLIPVFTTTITTVWAFLPLLLATGIIGEFIKSIPVVVSTALAASFFVSIFITLPLIIILFIGNIPKRVVIFLKIIVFLGIVGLFYILLPKNNNFVVLQVLVFMIVLLIGYHIRTNLNQAIHLFFHRIVIFTKRLRKSSKKTPVIPTTVSGFQWRKTIDSGIISFDRFNIRYRKMIEGIIKNPTKRRQTVAMVIIFFIFAFLLVPLGFVKSEFFPKSDQDIIYLNLELPAGTYINETQVESLQLLKTVKNTPELKFATLDVSKSYTSGQGAGSGGGNTALITLTLLKKDERKISSSDIADQLRKQFANYQKGTLSVVELSGGPPVGADLQIKLLGDNLNTLDAYANKVQTFLKQQKGVTNIEKSIKPGTPKVTFTPNLTVLSKNNMGIDQVGLYLRMYASGFGVGKIKFDGDTKDTDITLRFYQGSAFANSVNSVLIPNTSGDKLPISSLGTFSLTPNPTLITREEGKRTLSISASVTKGFNVTDLNKKLESYADTGLNLPSGYSWKTGGANEENQNSIQSILQAMILSFLLIIITMVVQFSSFRRALIVMLVIPLSISGVFIIFALLGIPLSFPALIGLLALFGIVVKNSILIVDRIVQNSKEGLTLIDSIGEASASRLEPIALTSFCTIVGLIPITLTDPLWRGLGGAIIAGLTFSGTIMLFFIPVVYYLLFRGEEKNEKLTVTNHPR